MTNPTGRQLFDIDLVPVAGERFQPTGFPDIGTALFTRPNRTPDGLSWVDSLIVESTQSMANHLEGTGWDRGNNTPVGALSGLPYVRVLDVDGGYLTSSRSEAHRLASAFIKDSTLDGVDMKKVIRDRLGLVDDRPLAPRAIAAAVFALDPLCLLHGVFFAESAKVWPGQPKIQRAISAFVEAVDVRRADYGGVKRDGVRHAIEGDAGGSSEGYGSIPYHRTDWVAGRILGSFCIDLAQIDSYGLGEAASELLAAIARWEIRSLLDGGMRFRTACDLVPAGSVVCDRDGVALEPLDALTDRISDLVDRCSSLLGAGRALDIVWNGGKKSKSS